MDWIKKLLVVFWVVAVVLLAVMALTFIFYKTSTMVYDESDRITGESIAIMTMLLGIPISMKCYYSYTHVKMPQTDDRKTLEKHISKWFFVRLTIIWVALALNYFAYLVYGSKSALLCVGVCLVFLLFFCRPNRNDLEDLLNSSIKKFEEKQCE